MSLLDRLKILRNGSGTRRTQGVSDERLLSFEGDPTLNAAIEDAVLAHGVATAENPEWASMDEAELCQRVQADFINFYDAPAVNPYVALSARGSWLVTFHGAVLHDSGGYGMLGMGHGPSAVLDTMAKPWVMANVMTPSLTHARFGAALRRELGHTRGGCPFDRFLAMNSGSESVTVATRISDISAKNHLQPGARYEGRTAKFLAIRGGFHGRTDRPAQASDSSLPNYRKHLWSFTGRDNLVTVPPNDVAALEAAFAKADADGVFFELMLAEPVMGEGNPGMAMTREFYDAARRLTQAHGTLLLIDSIQAGLRASGTLSIVDYSGFQDCDPPDLETYSKALNAGQYPMSILAMNKTTAALYRRGVYGNTMTANPRALEVGITVLDSITPALRKNIQVKGLEFIEALQGLRSKYPELVTSVQGTGLLVSCEIHPSIQVVGFGGLEEHCRMHGMGVIHGGVNALRFTPHFAISSDEIRLVVDILDDALGAFQLECATATASQPVQTLA